MSLTEDQIKGIASQLSKPEGNLGLEVAKNMHESNIGMTLSTAKALKIARNNVILELGHGNGKHIIDILDEAEDITYIGLEISELMKQEANSQSLPNTSFYLYDGENIPFDEDVFNKVLTVNTIYFWKNPVYLLKEVHRVLKKGGIFCIGFAQKEFMETLPFVQYGFNLYDNNKFRDLINQTDFNLIDLKQYSEQVKSKIGEMVERIYTVAILQK